jgi:Fe-S-cluster containining protein
MADQTYKGILTRADAFFDQVAREQPAQLQCGRGCSLCCYGLFEIGSGDVAVIAEGLSSMHPMRRKKVIRRAVEIVEKHARIEPREAFFEKTASVACPNLDESGACMMYEHRPLVCRTFGLPVRNGAQYIGDICELNFKAATQDEKDRAAWDLQWEDVIEADDELTIPEAIVLAARMRGWL